MKINFEKACKDALASTIEDVKNFDWSDSERYAMWSAQTFYYVHHSTRLLALASARSPLDKDNFHFKHIRHINEEKGHENLSKKDIQAMKLKLDEFAELSETKAMYQTQYYWIEHVSPFALFGYILALEGLSVYIGGEIYQRVVAAHGAEAGKFLKVHAEEDVDHLAEVYEWIDKIPEAHQKAVYENLLMSSKLYKNMLNAVDENCTLKVQNKSAA